MAQVDETQPFKSKTGVGEEARTPISHYELIILCIDVSQSMSLPVGGQAQSSEVPADANRSKTDEVVEHLLAGGNGFLARLAISNIRESFFIGIVAFDDRVTYVAPVKVDDSENDASLYVEKADLGFLYRHGKKTGIGLGLQQAKMMAADWLGFSIGDGSVPKVVTIIVLSDGQENMNSDPVGAKASIDAIAHPVPELGGRPSIVVAAAAYGDDADEKTLKAIATVGSTGRTMYKRVYTGQQLRQFCIQSSGL